MRLQRGRKAWNLLRVEPVRWACTTALVEAVRTTVQSMILRFLWNAAELQ